MCSRAKNCVFLDDKKVYCQRHRDLIKGEVRFCFHPLPCLKAGLACNYEHFLEVNIECVPYERGPDRSAVKKKSAIRLAWKFGKWYYKTVRKPKDQTEDGVKTDCVASTHVVVPLNLLSSLVDSCSRWFLRMGLKFLGEFLWTLKGSV